MDRKTIFETIVDPIRKSNKGCWSHVLKKQHPDLYDEILTYQTALTGKFTEHLYLWLHEFQEKPACKQCSVSVPFVEFDKGYRQFCSVKCARNNEDLQKVKEQTMIEKYGVTNFFKRNDLVQKSFQTKYGCSNPSKESSIQEKKKKIWLEKYGTDNPSKSPEIIAKIRQVNEELGIWIKASERDPYELYRLQVWYFTDKSWKEHFYKINPNRLPRGMDYHLDHKYSIKQGYLDSIDPEMIGHWVNLEILPADKNRQKDTSCSITKEELMERFYHEQQSKKV